MAIGKRDLFSQAPRMETLMRALFTMENCYGLRVCKCGEKVHLEVDSSQSEDAAALSRALLAWWEMFSAMTAGTLKKKVYDIWRYHFKARK